MNTPPSHPSGAVSRRRRWAARLSTLVVAAVAAATLAPQVATAAPTTVFSDDFARNVAGSWGASAAGSYAGYSVPGALSVDGSAAQLNLAPAQSVSVLAGTGSAGDVRADASIRLGQSAGRSYFAFILRYQNDGSAYRGRLELDAAGTPTLAVSRAGGGSDKQLAAVRLAQPLDRGEWYTLSYSVTGTSPVTVRASLTKRGADPATPQLTASDADGSRIEDAGRVGLWAYISSSATKNTELSLDDLAFADGAAPLTIAGGPSPTPTPTTTPTPTPTATPTPTTPPAATPTSTPTTPQPPATGGGSASSGDAGSVDVGRAAYPVPTGAVFVDAHALRSGNGSASSPFTTVQGAIDAAKPGGTIVVRTGVYHEALSIPSNKPLTIQAYPNEAVWFDGSRVVSAWTPSGSVWVSTGWTTSFDSSMRGQASMYVSSDHPTANRPDQLFVDGIALRQVASAAEVVAGTFAVDDAGDRLVLGTNPNGREVRASDISQAIDATAPNITLQGFGVRRYATTFGATAQVRMHNTGAVVRNLVIEDGAFIGLAVQNDDSVIDHVTVRRNGIMGIGVNQAYNLVLSNSLVTDNNAQHFNDIPVAGGIKITRSRNVTVTGNVVSNNDGSGIWFDESCYDVKIVRNTANDNSTSGIQLELSDTAVIAGNTSTGTRTGIQIINTGNVRIYNNELGANADNGIRLRQDARRSATHATGRDPRMGIDSRVPWITRNITIANNVFGSGGRYSIRANDGATNRPVDSWNVVITGNLFNNKAAGGPTMVAWGTGDNRSFEGYQSPAELSAAKNRSWVNAIAASALPLASMASAAASAASTAAPIPADVAALLGVGTTQRFVGVRSR